MQLNNRKSRALCGHAAIWEMIQMIGNIDTTNKDVAEVLVEHELDIRALLEVFQENLP